MTKADQHQGQQPVTSVPCPKIVATRLASTSACLLRNGQVQEGSEQVEEVAIESLGERQVTWAVFGAGES